MLEVQILEEEKKDVPAISQQSLTFTQSQANKDRGGKKIKQYLPEDLELAYYPPPPFLY